MSLYRIIKNTMKPAVSHVISIDEPAEIISGESYHKNADREKAYREGYIHAKQELEAALKESVKEEIRRARHEAISRVKSIVRKAIAVYSESREEMERANIEIITGIIKNITGDSGLDEKILEKNISDALSLVREGKDSSIIMKLNPDDLQMLEKDGRLADIIKGTRGIKIMSDTKVLKGDCIVETDTRKIVASMEEKLKKAREIMQDGGVVNQETGLVCVEGIVKQVVGTVIEVDGLSCSIGDVCEIITSDGGKKMQAEVVGYREGKNLLMPLSEMQGIGPKSRVRDLGRPFEIGLSESLLGRVIDGLGNPIDGGPEIKFKERRSIYGPELNPFERKRIDQVLLTGVRAIDTLLTCGKGQRMGIFSGSGVGKSTVLGMMARNTSAKVNVIALIGERGREVRDFIERDLGLEGLAKSVVIAATSEKSPLERIHGALVASTIAEFFKDMGYDVLLMMDSVTRFAMAQRELGLAVGEPPSTKGYTPSVFSKLPKLLERSGNFGNGGSITAFYTVLVEGDDMNEPIADAVRGILDGHIVLSRKLASRNHYPSIELTQSVSRIMPDITPRAMLELAGKAKETIAVMEEMEDLINIGAYKKGANPAVDRAVEIIRPLNEFLKQGIHEKYDFEKELVRLNSILKGGAA